MRQGADTKDLSDGWRRSRNDRGPQLPESTALSLVDKGYKGRVSDAFVWRHADGLYVALTFNSPELYPYALGKVAQLRNRLMVAAECQPQEWVGWTLRFNLGRR
jgi:hypothetical protein